MAEVAKYTSKFDPDSATYGVLALLRLSQRSGEARPSNGRPGDRKLTSYLKAKEIGDD